MNIPAADKVSRAFREANPHLYGPEVKPDSSCLDAGNELDSAMQKGGSNARPLWSPAEDTALADLYSQMISGALRHEDVAERMGRTPAACACRAQQLGIAQPRGKHFRSPAKTYQPSTRTPEELSVLQSEKAMAWHAQNVHPLKGKPVPNDVRQRISAANTGRKVPPERVEKALKTRLARFGSLAPKNGRGSWKSGWREVSGKKLYARSRWEANYARYLQFLKQAGQVSEWEHEPETFWFDNIKRGCRSYLPDFRVTLPDGAVEYHECKGWMDARSKTKIKRMAKYHPAVVLVVRDSTWFKQNRLKLRGLIPDWEDGRT